MADDNIGSRLGRLRRLSFFPGDSRPRLNSVEGNIVEGNIADENEAALSDAEDEMQLIHRAAAGDDQAIGRLMIFHLPGIVKLATRYRAYGVPMGDLVQEGAMALLQAVKGFNPNKGARLATYAKLWARSAMRDYVVRSASVVRPFRSRSHRHLFFHLRQIVAESPGEIEAGMSRLAQRFGLSNHERLLLLSRLPRQDISLNSVSDRADSEHQNDVASDPIEMRAIARQADSDPEDAMLMVQLRKQGAKLLRQALRHIPAREAFIVQGRFLSDPLVTRPILARKLGISKDRVRQLELQALVRLRGLLPQRDALLSS